MKVATVKHRSVKRTVVPHIPPSHRYTSHRRNPVNSAPLSVVPRFLGFSAIKMFQVASVDGLEKKPMHAIVSGVGPH